MKFTRPANVPARVAMSLSGCALVAGLLACSFGPNGQFLDQQAEAGLNEVLEVQIKSKFSHIKVSRSGSVRTLWFVRDSGEEVVESAVDLGRRQDLLVEYTRFMFMSYLFQPKPERVLIVGLGGGSMVHFLNHYDKDVKVDVAEIDPQIITVAANYFGVRTGGRVNIMNVDAFKYFKESDALYDVIYMDAFLKPSNETDETGVPMRLKTVNFYKEIQKRLNPDGAVVFNLNPHTGLDDDVAAIRAAFPQVYLYRLRFGGLVAVGSMAQTRMTPAEMAKAAASLERRFRGGLPFKAMADRIVR